MPSSPTMTRWSARQFDSMISSIAIGRPACANALVDSVGRAADRLLGCDLQPVLRVAMHWLHLAGLTAAESGTGVTRVAVGSLRRALQVLPLRTSDSITGAAWQDLANKVEAYECFRFAESIVNGGHARGDPDLAARVDRCMRLDRYSALWALEGLGYAAADHALEQDAGRGELRLGREVERLAPASWIPVHTGIGLSLASDVLEALDPGCSEAQLQTTLRRLIDLCRANSQGSYHLYALEALGFVSRNLHPHLLAPIDRQLQLIDIDLRTLLWHGVGRACYFAPSQLPTGPISTALELCDRDSPDERARTSSVSGLAWAVTLVNIRHPVVLESFVRLHHRRLQRSRDAVASGVASAISTWRTVHGSDRLLGAYVRTAPSSLSGAAATAWREMVQLPCSAALRGFQPGNGIEIGAGLLAPPPSGQD